MIPLGIFPGKVLRAQDSRPTSRRRFRRFRLLQVVPLELAGEPGSLNWTWRKMFQSNLLRGTLLEMALGLLALDGVGLATGGIGRHLRRRRLGSDRSAGGLNQPPRRPRGHRHPGPRRDRWHRWANSPQHAKRWTIGEVRFPRDCTWLERISTLPIPSACCRREFCAGGG